MEQLLLISRALSDSNRVRTLMALMEKELCACQITELLQLAPSTVSKHMSILKRAGLIKSRKNGRWIYYGLPGKNRTKKFIKTLDWLIFYLNDEETIKRDKMLLKKLLKPYPEELCGGTGKK